MAKYLLIESRDPFDSNGTSFCYNLATNLKKAGNEVTVFLVQNGVLPARPSIKSRPFTIAAREGVEILADDFSLRERGIPTDRLVEGIKAAPLDTVIDQMAEGRKVMWH